MNKLLLDPSLWMTGELKLKSNGDHAKSAPVTLVAYTGKAIDYPPFGKLVFDLSSMRHKGRVLLDRDHEGDSIGYLNRIEVIDNQLIMSGAITPNGQPDRELLIADMAEIPWQASIETHDFELELIDVGEVVHVNGRDLEGPLFVVRNWELVSACVCKYGRDADTSAMLLAASRNKKSAAKKVWFIAASKQEEGKQMVDETNVQVGEVAAVEAAVEVVAEEVKAEPVVEATNVTEPAVDQAEAVEAVDADKKDAEVAGEVVAEAVEVEAPVAIAAAVEVSVDPRAEFKQFVNAFGAELAATYYGEGLSLAEATTKFVAAIKAENDDLKNRLAASVSDRGADKAITFSADRVDEKKPEKSGIESVIRFAGKK